MAYLPDTPIEEIMELQHQVIPIKGLYFEYNGEKVQPKRLWFSSDTREWHNDPKAVGGRCYCFFDNALRPVFFADGEHVIIECFRNVVASYNGHIIYRFERE